MLIFNGDLAASIFSPSVFRNGSNCISLIYERDLHASGPSTRGSRGVETSFVDKDKRSEKWRNPGRLPFTLRPYFKKFPMRHENIRYMYQRWHGNITVPRHESISNGSMAHRELLKLYCLFARFACARTDSNIYIS